jgi:peptidyl-prolyl cis-trans isomerase A (cyclophilin A)
MNTKIIQIRAFYRQSYWRVFFILGCFLGGDAAAGTIVRIATSVGDYSIELFDQEAPITVENFLSYLRRGDYNRTYLHRVVDDFVVQGGAYRFELFVGPIDVAPEGPIKNEFGASNLAGTVAMAKFDGNPDSATNQWFVNMADNSGNLDTNNGGFTVFGAVLGEGLQVLKAIDGLPFVNLGDKAPSASFRTENYKNPLDFVYINAVITERFSSASHVFESATGILITSVNVDSASEAISLHLKSVPSAEGLVLQVDLESSIPRNLFEGVATFSSIDNKLRIPSLEVNLDGSVSVLRDVVFSLHNAKKSQFILETYATQ